MFQINARCGLPSKCLNQRGRCPTTRASFKSLNYPKNPFQSGLIMELPFLDSRDGAEALASRVSSSSIPPPVTAVVLGAIVFTLLIGGVLGCTAPDAWWQICMCTEVAWLASCKHPITWIEKALYHYGDWGMMMFPRIFLSWANLLPKNRVQYDEDGQTFFYWIFCF